MKNKTVSLEKATESISKIVTFLTEDNDKWTKEDMAIFLEAMNHYHDFCELQKLIKEPIPWETLTDIFIYGECMSDLVDEIEELFESEFTKATNATDKAAIFSSYITFARELHEIEKNITGENLGNQYINLSTFEKILKKFRQLIRL